MTSRARSALLPLLITLAILPGCLAPVAYVRPDLPGGFGWEEGAAPLAGNTALASAWWTAFADAGLNDLIPAVLAANHDVLAASLRARRALLEAGIAAEFASPKLNAGFDASRTMPLEGNVAHASDVRSTFGLSYDIDLWGRIAAQRDVATLEAHASRHDIEAARLTVIAATIATWWRLAHANQMLHSAEKSLVISRRTEEIVRTMRAAEAVSELETLEVRQAIETQRAGLQALKRERDAQRVALAVLLNGAANTAAEPTRLPSGRLPEVKPGLPASLIGRRPDLRAAEFRLRASLRRVDERKASFYPQISLTGNLGQGGKELAEILSNPVAALGAKAVLPFLNLKETGLQIRVSEVQYEEAVVAFRATMLTAFSEVANGLSARQSLACQADHLSRALDAQRRIEALYETRLRAGLIGLRPLLEAQERTRTAENALIDNRLAQLLNQATLYRALGGAATSEISDLETAEPKGKR